MRLVVVLLVLLLAGCSSSAPTAGEPDPEPPASWLAMVPGDAFTFDGPGGELVLIYVDETYSIGRVNASALTWKLGEEYTTDYFLQDDDGTLWWYGRRGSWRVGRHGERPREIPLDRHTARFGDRTIILSEDGDPLGLTTPAGSYERT